MTRSTSESRYRRAIDVERVDRKRFLVNDPAEGFPVETFVPREFGQREPVSARVHAHVPHDGPTNRASRTRLAEGY